MRHRSEPGARVEGLSSVDSGGELNILKNYYEWDFYKLYLFEFKHLGSI